MQRSAFCRSRRELPNAYFLAKFGFDTAENELSKVCAIFDAVRRGTGKSSAGAPTVVVSSGPRPKTRPPPTLRAARPQRAPARDTPTMVESEHEKTSLSKATDEI